MSERKMRKCNQCGAAMAIKKGSKGKFWACTKYRDGCANTAEFHGFSPKAGLDLDIRAIENGFIIMTCYKYAEDVDDEETIEVYCHDEDALRNELSSLLEKKAEDLMDRMSISNGYFVEEEEDKPIKVKKQNSVSDVRELLKNVAKGRKQAKEH